LEAVVAGLECGDLRVTRIGVLPAGRGLRDLLFELLLQAGIAAVEGGAGHAGLAGQGGDVTVAAGRDVAGQQPGGRGTDALLDLAALLAGDTHGYLPPGSAAASMASTTRWALSSSAFSRVCSILRVRPSMPRNTMFAATVPAHTSRWRGWWVAWEQRAESHMPISGVPAA